MQITLWSPPSDLSLHDYAWKQWAGQLHLKSKQREANKFNGILNSFLFDF
jgi:hypothetical protein